MLQFQTRHTLRTPAKIYDRLRLHVGRPALFLSQAPIFDAHCRIKAVVQTLRVGAHKAARARSTVWLCRKIECRFRGRADRK